MPSTKKKGAYCLNSSKLVQALKQSWISSSSAQEFPGGPGGPGAPWDQRDPADQPAR